MAWDNGIMHVSTWIGRVGRVWQQVGDEVVDGAADERGMLLPSGSGPLSTLVKTRQARPEKLAVAEERRRFGATALRPSPTAACWLCTERDRCFLMLVHCYL